MTKKQLIIKSISILLALQIVLNIIKAIIYPKFADNLFAKQMIMMAMMAIVIIGFIFLIKKKNMDLSIFPKEFTKKYIFITVVAGILFASNPGIYVNGYEVLLQLIYGSIITPIFEELIFRGYIWNESKKVTNNIVFISLFNIVMFTLWNLGYMVDSIMQGNLVPVFTKLLIAFGYGVILSITRIKTNNCYSTIIVHGLLNMFML